MLKITFPLNLKTPHKINLFYLFLILNFNLHEKIAFTKYGHDAIPKYEKYQTGTL